MTFSLKKDLPFASPAPAVMVGAGLFAIFLLFFWSSLNNLLSLWLNDKTYSHGLLIPFLSVYLIAKENKKLLAVPLKPAPLLIVPLSLTLLVWLIAFITNTLTVELTFLPLIFILAYTSLVGYSAAKILTLPLLYILIATPIWGILTPYFQLMAVFVNEKALYLSGISTFIHETTVSIPAGNFEVEGGCAGIRYLVVSLALAGFYSLLNFKHIKNIFILLLAAFCISIAFNWIRIYIIILIGHFTDMQSPLIEDHSNFGWLLYGISLIPLYFIAQKLTATENIIKQQDCIEKPANSAFQPYPKSYIIFPITLMISTAAFTIFLENKEIKTVKEITTPLAETPWAGPIYYNQWQPDYKGARIVRNVQYIGTDDNPDINLHIFYYGNQEKDHELINIYNRIDKPELIHSKKVLTIENQEINKVEILIEAKSQLVWYWYLVNNETTIKPFYAKILQSKELLSELISSSLIALSIRCQSDCTAENEKLTIFFKKHKNKINNSILNL